LLVRCGHEAGADRDDERGDCRMEPGPVERFDGQGNPKRDEARSANRLADRGTDAGLDRTDLT